MGNANTIAYRAYNLPNPITINPGDDELMFTRTIFIQALPKDVTSHFVFNVSNGTFSKNSSISINLAQEPSTYNSKSSNSYMEITGDQFVINSDNTYENFLSNVITGKITFTIKVKLDKSDTGSIVLKSGFINAPPHTRAPHHVATPAKSNFGNLLSDISTHESVSNFGNLLSNISTHESVSNFGASGGEIFFIILLIIAVIGGAAFYLHKKGKLNFPTMGHRIAQFGRDIKAVRKIR